jgi:hypothetical protein
VTEAVCTQNHEFTAVTIQRGTPYRFYVEGTWEIRYGNQLWQHNLRWVPDDLRIAEWEGTPIQIINADHLRNKFGDMFRMH